MSPALRPPRPSHRGSAFLAVSPWLLAVVTVCTLAAHASDPSPPTHTRLTEQERRGQAIYLRGTPESGRSITALFGDAKTKVPASALLCVNCHGHDGQGRPEGGVSPSNLTWKALTKPYGSTHPSGRKHPAYNERFLRRAITMGIDPAGNKLATTMPRYQLTRQEVDDLVAYLKQLGSIQDPGLTDTTIRLGVLLPPTSSSPNYSQTVRTTLTGFFDDLNEQGGVYNRKIQLRFANAGTTPDQTALALNELINQEGVFCLTSTFIRSHEQEVSRLIEQAQVPLIGAITQHPALDYPLNRYIFYLLAGTQSQARAMLDHAVDSLGVTPAQMAVLCPDQDPANRVAGAIEQQCRNRQLEPIRRITYPPGRFQAQQQVQQLKQQGVQVLFFLGSGKEQQALITQARLQAWEPAVMIPGPMLTRPLIENLSGFRGRVYLSFPRGPKDQSAMGVRGFRSFAQKHNLPTDYLATQVEIYTAAKTLVEGLKRAGKKVSREKLVAALEGLYEFETGLTPLISFGPNRRIGALGAYIISVNPDTKKLTPASDWIKLR